MHDLGKQRLPMAFRAGEKISPQAQEDCCQGDDNNQICQWMKQYDAMVFRRPGIDDGAREVEAAGHRHDAA